MKSRYPYFYSIVLCLNVLNVSIIDKVKYIHAFFYDSMKISEHCPPVTINEKSLTRRLERNWTKVESVAWGKANVRDTTDIMTKMDKVLEITLCSHTILLCNKPRVWLYI